MPLKNRNDIIATLESLSRTVADIPDPTLKGKALKDLNLLLDTFAREKKKPRGGKKGGC